MSAANTAAQKDTRKSSRCLSSGQRRPFDTATELCASRLEFSGLKSTECWEAFSPVCVLYVWSRRLRRNGDSECFAATFCKQASVRCSSSEIQLFRRLLHPR